MDLFWGSQGEDFDGAKQAKLCGEDMKPRAHSNIMDVVADLNRKDETCTARELIQAMAEKAKGSVALPKPRAVKERPQKKPYVYSDGSVHNPKSFHWQVGGIGAFWPGRSEAQTARKKKGFVCTTRTTSAPSMISEIAQRGVRTEPPSRP